MPGGRSSIWPSSPGYSVGTLKRKSDRSRISRSNSPGATAASRSPFDSDQWVRIKDFLPGRDGHVGGTAADTRLFVEAVLFRFRAGVPWRDLPGRFGDWKIVYQRFNRWAKSGVFERVFKALASDPDNEYMLIDATIVRAHQHSAGARKKTANKRSADPAAD